VRNGRREREQCYDCAGPFLGSFQRWYCREHKHSFSVTTTEPGLQSEIAKQRASHSLLIFPRVILTQAFVQMVRIYIYFNDFVYFILGCGNICAQLELKKNSARDKATVGQEPVIAESRGNNVIFDRI
jgi:hypothetical protein